MVEFWLTTGGLILNTIGGVLLYFFGVKSISVTAAGEDEITFINTTAPKERQKNLTLYRRHHFWSQTGLLMLVVGFVAQLVAVIWPHICSR